MRYILAAFVAFLVVVGAVAVLKDWSHDQANLATMQLSVENALRYGKGSRTPQGDLEVYDYLTRVLESHDPKSFRKVFRQLAFEDQVIIADLKLKKR
jgi:hypothetical protein